MLFKETPFWCFSPTESEQELQQSISNGSCLSLLPNICARDYTSLPSLARSLRLLGSAVDKERGEGEGCYPVPYLSEKKSLRHMVLHKITSREKPGAALG